MLLNKHHLLLTFVAGVAIAGAAVPVAAREEITLHTFTGGNGDGAEPMGVTADRKGNLFGTTHDGGINSCGGGAGCGTIFETSPVKGSGWNTSTIYSFTDGDDGGFPNGPLVVDDTGALYGALGNHTDAPGGSVFALIPANGAWSFETLYPFQNGDDGAVDVYSPLLVEDGHVYGTTPTGGTGSCQSGCGTLFRLAPPKSGGLPWTHTTLFSFPGGDGRSWPGWIVDSGQKDTFYVAAGPLDSNGAVVSLAAAQGGTWSETVLYTFKGGKDGSNPYNLIVGSDGTIYGTAGLNGTRGGGLVFSLTPPRTPGSAWTKTTLYADRHFVRGPTSLALEADGTLVGTEFGEIDFFAGNLFELTPAGNDWTYRQIYSFNRRGPSRNPDSAIVGKGGHLYGALDGGDSDDGAIFEIR